MQFDVLTALLERSGMSQRALQKKDGLLARECK